jgi:hypothetical protein
VCLRFKNLALPYRRVGAGAGAGAAGASSKFLPVAGAGSATLPRIRTQPQYAGFQLRLAP